jgi:hypothetical protein
VVRFALAEAFAAVAVVEVAEDAEHSKAKVVPAHLLKHA